MAPDETGSIEPFSPAETRGGAAPLAAQDVAKAPLARLSSLVFLLPGILAFVVYRPFLSDYFAFDDLYWLRGVHRGWASVLVRAFTFPAATPFDAITPSFRPAGDLILKLELAAFGFSPAPYHVVNLLVHAGVAGLGGLLVTRLTRSTATGLLAACFFAVSPTYKDAVYWISEFTELFGALFALAAMLAYGEYLSVPDARRARLWLAGAAIALTLAVLSKESQTSAVVLLPALAFVVEDRRRPAREIAIGLVALAIAAAVYLIYVLANEYFGDGNDAAYRIGFHGVGHWWTYLQRTVFPYGGSAGWVASAQGVLAVAYLALGATMLVTRRRTAAFFFLWSLVAIVPFAFSRYAAQPRYTYLPTLPAFALLATVALDAWRALPERGRAPTSVASALLVVAALGFSGREARRQQASIVTQAAAYERLITAVRGQCDGIEPGGTLYLNGASALDPFGVIVPAGVNLFRDRVYVSGGTPPASVDGRTACVVNVGPP